MNNRTPNSDPGNPGEPSPPQGITKLTDSLNDSVWELHKPTEGIPAVEIIFFHGLQLGHDYENAFWKTWTARNNGDVVWPKDWLGEAFPQARILSISYKSSVRTNSEQPDSLGEILINDIINDDHNIGQFCPVILVGHSLGGIVIKQFLLSTCKEIYSGNGLKHFKVDSFRKNFKGVLYYATPHGDANLSHFANFIPQTGPYVNFFGMLKTNMESINEEFRDARGKNFQAMAYTVAEGLPTSWSNSKVMEEDSKVVEEVSKVPEKTKKRKRDAEEALKVPEEKKSRKAVEEASKVEEEEKERVVDKWSSPRDIVLGSDSKGVEETSTVEDARKILVVERDSSKLDTDFHKTVKADHFDVCKPDKTASKIFKQLVKFINKII